MDTTTEMINIYPDKLIIYDYYFDTSTGKKMVKNQLDNLKKKTYSGVISDAATKKINKVMMSWANALKAYNKVFGSNNAKDIKQLTFVTLTLQSKQIHTDKEIKREILNKFIIRLQRNFNVTNYFWRAEKQMNGNIHFHFILDVYIHYAKLRKAWNECSETLGYITAFEKKHGHRNPNSTDVKMVNNLEMAIKYVSKYCTKNEGSELISGAVYGMSDKLRALSVFNSTITNKIDTLLNYLKSRDDVKIFQNEHCFMMFYPVEIYESFIYRHLQTDIDAYYLNVYNYLFHNIPLYQSFSDNVSDVYTSIGTVWVNDKDIIAETIQKPPIQLSIF